MESIAGAPRTLQVVEEHALPAQPGLGQHLPGVGQHLPGVGQRLPRVGRRLPRFAGA